MESHLKWVDYLILVGFLLISLAIGIYHSLTGGRQKTTAEFIMGNRRLKVIPTAISLLVSFFSAIMLLGITAEIYSYGAQYLIFSTVSMVLSIFFVERIIVTWLYPLKLVSLYEYLELRYRSKSIRIFGSSLAILNGVLLTGLEMYAPSAALESASGLPLRVSIPTMAVVAVVCTALVSTPAKKEWKAIFTVSEGGMRAVIWADVFQFLMMFSGMVAIFVKGLIAVGGIANVFRLAGEEGRLVLASISIDPRERHTVWSLTIGLIFSWINTYGLSQSAVQRYSAVDKLSKARKTVLLLIPSVVIMQVVAGITGVIVLANYSSVKCDPLANKDIVNPNNLLPYFVVTLFTDSPGFSGLFLSTLYGAALSSVSSLLSGSAAICWEDILKWKLSHLPETRKALINKLLVVLLGALGIGVAFLSASVPGPIIQVMFAMVSSVKGPLFAFFVIGAVSKHANWKGTLLGGIVGALFTMWLGIGSLTLRHKHPPLPPMSVEKCSIGNGSSTLLASSLNYTNYTYYEASDEIWPKNNWNQTAVVLSEAGSQLTQLRGLENFYAISYLWFFPIGVLVTGVIGIVASFIMRDKHLEEINERLLLRFRFCGWSDEKENQEHMDDENCASLQETKGLNGPENDFLKDVEIMALQKNEKRFHNEIKSDLKKDTKDGFVTKNDQGQTSCVLSTC